MYFIVIGRSKKKHITYWNKQSWSLDNSFATLWQIFSVHKAVCNWHFYFICCSYPIYTPMPNNFVIFFLFLTGPWGSVTLSHCRVVVVAKIKNCRVRSSEIKFKRLPLLWCFTVDTTSHRNRLHRTAYWSRLSLPGAACVLRRRRSSILPGGALTRHWSRRCLQLW